ncbi:ATP-binding protein [Actinacidiphila alni]
MCPLAADAGQRAQPTPLAQALRHPQPAIPPDSPRKTAAQALPGASAQPLGASTGYLSTRASQRAPAAQLAFTQMRQLQVSGEPLESGHVVVARTAGVMRLPARFMLVLAARERAAARYHGTPWRLNSEIPGHEMRTRWHVAPGALHPAERDMERGLLTARGLDRVLRVAWTLADLASHDRPDADDVVQALHLRTGINRGVPVPGGV